MEETTCTDLILDVARCGGWRCGHSVSDGVQSQKCNDRRHTSCLSLVVAVSVQLSVRMTNCLI
jgi:hypothetical protein